MFINYPSRILKKKLNNEFHLGKGNSISDKVEIYYKYKETRLPIYSNYRYSLKPCWKYFGPLSALSDLKKKGILTEKSKEFLGNAIGKRTLTVSLEEASKEAGLYLEKYNSLFLNKEIIPLVGKRLLIPSDNEINEEVASFQKSHKRMLLNLKKKGVVLPRKPKLLEIGYTSGGASIFAFEKMGFKVSGIDYFFDNSVRGVGREDVFREKLKSTADFRVGDITQKTEFADNYFDVIFSSSVIEHIKGVNLAFEEMFRILKPGGVCIHSYDPYFHPRGGHSFGIPDQP